MKVEVIPPLKCPGCGSTACHKTGKHLIQCHDCLCETDTKKGKKKKKYFGKTGGHDPKVDTGDYLE